MVNEELNEKLTRVGAGTPGGELLRRYWHPIAATAELKTEPTKRVRILAEDLVLYQDGSGGLGLVEEPCAHRRASLAYGIPEAHGIRCPYHGWLYDEKGNCLEQPAEPGSGFKDKIKIKAFPVQEMGGLIWAYLGPDPAPLLPRYDQFVWDNAVRNIAAAMIPCNWVQIMENSFDATHVEWLHGYYSRYVQSREQGRHFDPADWQTERRHHVKIGFDVWEHGVLKRRIEEGGSEEDDDWKIGHTVIFPEILGNPTLQIRVPVDDTHTWHLWYTAIQPGVPVPPQDPVPLVPLVWQRETRAGTGPTPTSAQWAGELITDFVDGQDIMAWVTQGAVAQRHLEHLGAGDVGIILFRDVLKEQIEKVERGEEPMNVIRDPARNVIIELPRERVHHGQSREQQERERQAEREPGLQNGGAAEPVRTGGRPVAPEYRDLLRDLRRQAAKQGIDPIQPPVPEIIPVKRVVADLV